MSALQILLDTDDRIERHRNIDDITTHKLFLGRRHKFEFSQ